MLTPKYIAFIFFIWITGSILGTVMEQEQFGSTEETTLSQLTVWQEISSEESWGLFDVVSLVPGFFTALFQILTFQFAFITGPLVYIRWIVLAPITAMIMWGLTVVFIGILRRGIT